MQQCNFFTYVLSYELMAQPSPEAFESLIAQNQQAVYAPDEQYQLVAEASALSIRQRGSFVTNCVLQQAGTGISRLCTASQI